MYDISVYHPRTKWEYGRPNWIFEHQRQPYFVDKSAIQSYPCLVFAYYANEDSSNSVPTDVIEIKSPGDKIALALAKGEFIIVIEDSKRQKQTFHIIVN